MADEIVQTKTCGRCKQCLPVAEFYKNRRTKDGLKYDCMACCKAVRESPEVRAKSKEYWRRSYARLKADPERFEARAARHRPKQRQHYQENKEKYYANVSARKARKFGGGGSHSSEAWRQMVELFGGKCLCCGSTERLTRDHVQPVSRGGSDDITNLQPLCMRCNKGKFTLGRDYRTREKVVLAELNDVGRLLFETDATVPVSEFRKHGPRSGYTGVGYAPKCERSAKAWRARIQVNGKLMNLGRYETPEEAALAYNRAAREIFGPSAWTNEVPVMP